MQNPSIEKIWQRAIKEISKKTGSNLHLVNEEGFKWNMFGLPLEKFEAESLSK